jgi:hypothetical protein
LNEFIREYVIPCVKALSAYVHVVVLKGLPLFWDTFVSGPVNFKELKEIKKESNTLFFNV